MNCQEFWDTMPELAGETPDGMAREHVERCASCASLLEGHRDVAEALRRVAGESRRIVAPPRLEARVLADYRAHSGVKARGAWDWWLPLATWSGATVATAGLALLLVLVHGRLPSAKTAPVEGPPHRRPPAHMQLASLPALDLDLMQPDLMQPDAMQSSTEADAQFIPLPNAEQLGPNDEIGIVRLEVPRSAMAALGFVVAAERASETVEADVQIGPDGLAHAVRFVNQSKDLQE
jgi:hypothetical protein